MQRLTSIILFLVVLPLSGCASKATITYQGQCLINNHSFCSESFTELSTCQSARRIYERETSHRGTCSRG